MIKTLLATVCLVAITLAEPPPSNSYLPPPPAGRAGGGYPRGGPQASANGNGFTRGKLGGEGYDQNASPFGRNGLDDASSEPASYNFGYNVNDHYEGTDFGHHEERQDERAHGEYHVVLPDGRKQTVRYEADERGFKPRISYEDGEPNSRSNGHDSNANNVGHNGNHGNGGNVNHGNGF